MRGRWERRREKLPTPGSVCARIENPPCRRRTAVDIRGWFQSRKAHGFESL